MSIRERLARAVLFASRQMRWNRTHDEQWALDFADAILRVPDSQWLVILALPEMAMVVDWADQEARKQLPHDVDLHRAISTVRSLMPRDAVERAWRRETTPKGG